MGILTKFFNNLKKNAATSIKNGIKDKLTDGKIELPKIKIPTVTYGDGLGTPPATYTSTPSVPYSEGESTPTEPTTPPIVNPPVENPTETTAVTPTSTTTTVAETPMTYEQFLAKERQFAADNKNLAYQSADTIREKALVDANTSYQQNQSTYGARAEALGKAGLTGSGYGEYLDSMAYAQMRADKNAADAQANYAKLSADNTYSDYIRALNQNEIERAEKAEDNKNDIYAQIIAGAADGTYNEDVIGEIGSTYGLTPEQITKAQGVYSKYLTDNDTSATGENAADNIYIGAVENGVDVNVTTEQAKAVGASEEDIRKATENMQNTYSVQIKNQITAGEVTSKATLDDQLSRGNISQAHYDELSKLLVAQNDKVADSAYSIAISTSDDEATKFFVNLDNMYNNGEISNGKYNSIYEKDFLDDIKNVSNSEQYNQLLDSLENKKDKLGDKYATVKAAIDKRAIEFGQKSYDTKVEYKAGISATGFNKALGDKFQINIDGKKFNVVSNIYGSDALGSKVAQKLKGSLNDGHITIYEDELFYEKDDKLYRLRGNDADKLKEYLKSK